MIDLVFKDTVPGVICYAEKSVPGRRGRMTAAKDTAVTQTQTQIDPYVVYVLYNTCLHRSVRRPTPVWRRIRMCSYRTKSMDMILINSSIPQRHLGKRLGNIERYLNLPSTPGARRL